VTAAHPTPTVALTLAQSYAACEALARRAASSFFSAFRVLSTPQRRSMCALYAFLRIADDISDEPGLLAEKQRQLHRWREGFDRALAGDYTHPVYPALHDSMQRFRIPRTLLENALDGVEMDLVPQTYGTFADLERYCYRVASVVGLACIHIWGFTGARAAEYAVNAGIAFQLTNILRDLAEDAARGRVYLPQEDLERFRYRRERLERGERDENFRALMAFEVARARGFYDAAWPLVPLLRPAGRAVFLVMARTYRALLDVMEQRDYDVFSDRIRVGRWRKLLLAMAALPARLDL
jgi:15-cis-phytoene synthase